MNMHERNARIAGGNGNGSRAFGPNGHGTAYGRKTSMEGPDNGLISSKEARDAAKWARNGRKQAADNPTAANAGGEAAPIRDGDRAKIAENLEREDQDRNRARLARLRSEKQKQGRRKVIGELELDWLTSSDDEQRDFGL